MTTPDFDLDDANATDAAGTPQGDGDFESDNLPSTGETTSGGQLNTGEADHRNHQASRTDVPGPQQPGDMKVATTSPIDMLEAAIAEARTGLAEGGIPIGAAIFNSAGQLISSGHNRRVQDDDPSAHGETDAFRRAGRQRTYRDLIMVTTLAPCWYCSGLIRQFGFRRVIVGESQTFQGGIQWLRENGIEVIDLDSPECKSLLGAFVRQHPAIWNEDIGVD